MRRTAARLMPLLALVLLTQPVSAQLGATKIITEAELPLQ